MKVCKKCKVDPIRASEDAKNLFEQQGLCEVCYDEQIEAYYKLREDSLGK